VTAGVKDVVPQALDSGCYEGFEDLVDKANVWLKEQRGNVLISNMQSIMVVKDEGQSTALDLHPRHFIANLINILLYYYSK